MACVDIDVNKSKEMFDKLSKYVSEYNTEIDTFFDNVVNNSGWIGEAANDYSEFAKSSKNQYTVYGEALLKFIDTSSSAIADLDNYIKNNGME